jgi:hypothetical protein
MFSGTPKNYDGISQLIDRVRYVGGEGSDTISLLLESVNDFLTATRPERQTKRDKDITEKRIVEILTNAANAIESFSGPAEALQLAKDTIEERLKELRKNKDKICIYYDSHDNPLKKAHSGVRQGHFIK